MRTGNRPDMALSSWRRFSSWKCWRHRSVPHGWTRALRRGLLVRRASLFLAMVAACAGGGAVVAIMASDYEAMAALLYNVAKFVEWPSKALPETSPSLVLCILGEDPIGAALDQDLQGKKVNGKELVIKQYREVQDIEGCHILFIGASERQRLAEIFHTLNHSSVLTVAHMERFANLGGMINFIIRDNKVQFEINVDAAERAGLKMSSKVLKFAKIVRGGEKN